MADYTYRLPRKYRYRKGASSRDKAIGLAIVVAALASAHGAAAVAHHGVKVATAAVYVPAGSNEALANSMATSGYGWTGVQATCLDDLWTEESAGTWSPTVTNPTSGAYGIPQALPADKMASAGADWQTSPATQVRWGLQYIHDRYGSPCAAWAFETSHVPNWY